MQQKIFKTTIQCVLHGSFRKHFNLIKKIHDLFTQAGIEVIAPEKLEVTSTKDGFALFTGQENIDQRLIELRYLHKLKKLGSQGFSYFVNPEGYIGKSTSYELGIAQLSNIRCFFYESIHDHPAYIHKNSIWKPEDLVEYISKYNTLPSPAIKRNEKFLHKLWEDLIFPGSVVAAGAIIEFKTAFKEKEILLVKTHKWGGRYSMVGGKVRRNERLDEALVREVKEETGLDAELGKHICTFDQIKDSGYYKRGVQHIFVDKVVTVARKRVYLNDEAQSYLWVPVKVALSELEIEPNARHTLELYAANQQYI